MSKSKSEFLNNSQSDPSKSRRPISSDDDRPVDKVILGVEALKTKMDQMYGVNQNKTYQDGSAVLLTCKETIINYIENKPVVSSDKSHPDEDIGHKSRP